MILLLASLGFAQDNPLDTVPSTPEEAWAALREGELLTARRMATEVLHDDPDDYVANYVVAKVYWDEDANLPRALFHYRKADAAYGDGGASFSKAEHDLFCTVLADLAWVAEDMEDSARFYRTLDRYNATCNPKKAAELGWRLMKDERLAEARKVGETGVASDKPFQRLLGHNVLCALEALERDRMAAVTACERSLEQTREDGYDLTVEAYNTSTATLSALDFERTEELLTLATQGSIGGSTNPWQPMTTFRLQQGKGKAAIEAIEASKRWQRAQPPPERARSRAESDGILATVLLVAGATDLGMQVIDRALLRPDRRASTTATGDTTKAAHTLVRRAMRRVHAEREQERAATLGILGRVRHWLSTWVPDPDDRADELVLQGVLTDPAVFRATFAIYQDQGIPLPPWMIGDLIPVLGPGVVTAELATQRTLERHQGIHAYYDALDAEAAWRRGRSDTVALARHALEGLPEREVLLRGRVAAFAGDAAWSAGDPTAAMGFWERAFDWDPSAFRRLGIALPASISTTGGTIAADAADMVARSPRVFAHRNGLRVDVRDHDLCVATAAGNRIGCVSGPSEPTDTPAASLVEAWHIEAFGLPLELSRVDLSSLDGTTYTADDARRQELEDLIGDF